MKETLTLILLCHALVAGLRCCWRSLTVKRLNVQPMSTSEMVCLFKETSGEFGWPDFKNLNITCGE
jgi:hypothetical protein